MFKELKVARELLERTLEKYLDACAAVRKHAHRPLFSHTREHSARMEDEMTAIIACEKKIKQAKKFISQAINHSPFVAPINSLPDEILSRVFHITLGLQPCFTDINDPDIKDEGKRNAFAQVPERLSHVCCRWRRLAVGLPTLWQHIDINTDALDVLSRANTRMGRTGQLPLDIHIIGDLLGEEELDSWVAFAAPRIKSFTLITTDKLEIHKTLLNTCFRCCTPGTLTHLTIWKENAVGPNETSLILHLGDPFSGFAAAEFDTVYRQITSLRLRQVYPYWTSRVYHGLTELHLASHQISPSELLEISIAQLVVILQSSPKLRVVRLDLKISTDGQGTDELPVPVRLDDLEALDLSAESREPNLEHLKLVLPIFAPGTKPIQLTIDDLDDDRHLLLEDEVQAFFTRSNVVSLKLVYDESLYKELDFELLSRLAPRLGRLVLDHYSWGEYRDDLVGSYPRFHIRDNSAPNSRVEYLYLHRCDIDLEWCPQLLKGLTYQPQVLVFWKCDFVKGGERGFDDGQIEDAFHEVCRDVRVLEWEAPKPPDDWALDSMPRLY